MLILRTMLIALFALAAPAAGAETVRPFDEALDDAALAAAREAVAAAVAARDPERLMAYADPDIGLGANGRTGRDIFREMLEADPSLWGELEWILANGGAFTDDGRFLAPYTVAATVDADPSSTGIVTGRQVNVRTAPASSAPVVDRLSHAVVEVLDWHRDVDGPAGDWVRVALPGGRQGYVAKTFMGSPSGTRVVFERTGDAWVMTRFVAGD